MVTVIQDENYWKSENVAFLGISSLRGVGYWTLWNLYLTGRSYKDILKSPLPDFKNTFKHAGYKGSFPEAAEWETFQKDLWDAGNKSRAILAHHGISLLHAGESRFPQALLDIPDPPKWLFVKGNISALTSNSIAIVGTRAPSADGLYLTQHVCGCLPRFDNVVTVSGLAPGIDQLVHSCSIRYRTPTIAVLGTGILSEYPAGTEALKETICATGGAIITEYLPNQSYSRENFVRRNRLQAGLASVVIPAEWSMKSGTAHTVRFAERMRKKVICLKMPDWDDSARPEIRLAKELSFDVFTLPGEEEAFMTSVRTALSAPLITPPKQLELWSGGPHE